MYFRIGSTPLDPNSAAVTRTSVARLNRAGNPITRVWTWSVRVYLASAVTTPVGRQIDFAQQETRLHNLLERPGQEYALHCDDGSVAMVLSPVRAIAAPKAYEIGNLVEGRGEYSGLRTMDFKVSAEYPVGNLAGVLMNFEERLTFQGDGGPDFEDFQADNGATIRQIIRPKSACFAYQSGTATGFLAYPTFGGPHGAPVSLWPADYRSKLSTYDTLPARVTGETLTEFAITWNYTHSRIGVPFVGVPRQWR